MANFIDMRGSPYQPCWGCGYRAGGRKAHRYYGNFPFGVQHLKCGIRISILLDRSFRALSALDNSCDSLVHESISRALITTTARKLGNGALNTIEDDHVIRHIVETDGIDAALKVFRSLSSLDDITWESRLKEHNAIMFGPEFIELEDKDPMSTEEFNELFNAGLEAVQTHQDKCIIALKRMIAQMKQFSENIENETNKVPYCILEDVIRPLYRNLDDKGGLKKYLEKMDSGGTWRVILLAVESEASRTQVNVEHIALLPNETPFSHAKDAWKKECNIQKGFRKEIYSFDCLKREDYTFFIKEIGVCL